MLEMLTKDTTLYKKYTGEVHMKKFGMFNETVVIMV